MHQHPVLSLCFVLLLILPLLSCLSHSHSVNQGLESEHISHPRILFKYFILHIYIHVNLRIVTSALILSQQSFSLSVDVMYLHWAALHSFCNVYPDKSLNWLLKCPNSTFDTFKFIRKWTNDQDSANMAQITGKCSISFQNKWRWIWAVPFSRMYLPFQPYPTKQAAKDDVSWCAPCTWESALHHITHPLLSQTQSISLAWYDGSWHG